LATRRQFLRVGLAASAVLVAARWLQPAMAEAEGGYRVLDLASARLLGALVPVVLDGALPHGPERPRHVRETVEAFDRAVSALAPAVRAEVEQLFSFLAFRPTRAAMAGLWEPIDRASAGEISAFLARWRHSRFDLQRQAYLALTQLIQAAWYGNSASWPAIGYAGPPAIA